MHGIDFIQDFAVILLVAGAVGWLCQRLGLSVIVGYLIAGVVVGPHTPPFALVKDIGRVETLAQLGLIFLMFSVGLRLSLRKLRRLGFSRLIAVFFSAAIIYYLTRLVGIAAGWDWRTCLFVAAMLMVSSSAIINKVLQETGRTHDRVGQLAMGVSVLEDVVAVVMLTLLNSVVQFKGSGPDIGHTLGLFGAFVALAGIGGLLLVPILLRRLSITADEELQTVVLAALLFGLALVAQRAGYSLALGAFLLGTIVAETPHRTQVERTFEGLRDVFTAVFFVAIGMQLDLHAVAGSWVLIAGIAVFTVVARALAISVGLAIVGTAVKDSMRVGLSVTPIGEFSFIIAQLGVIHAIVPPSLYAAAVSASLLTTLVAPPLTKNSEQIAIWVLSRRPSWFRVWHSHYYDWLEYLQGRGKRNLLWQLTRKRFLQIGVEMLFVTGLLVFSEPLRRLVDRSANRDWLFPHGPEILFWVAMTLIVLAPLVAIWRNVSALCLLFAQVIATGKARSARIAPVVEGVFKLVAAAGLFIWLATVFPMGGGASWILGASLLVALVGLFFFQRKLVLWHSELEVGLQDVFRAGSPAADTAAPWLRSHSDWDLSVGDCVLPDLADCQGKKIAELELRAKFGCTVVGIGRQGFLMSLPSPDTVLYPRDKLLLLGSNEQVAAGRKFLSTVSGNPLPISEFDDLRMEAVQVPPDSVIAGKDLKTLSPSHNYKVQIAGVNRAGSRILNPTGEEIILAGDELLVLGTSEQIRAFKEWLTETVTEPTGS